ncbi:MAG: chemotaxis protein CheW [Longimicrobiales bacterium]
MSIDAEALREATERVAAPIASDRAKTESAFIFRVGAEWFALPTSACDSVIDPCSVHSVPHRSGGLLLGIGNVAGDIVLVISLPALLGIGSVGPPDTSDSNRMLLFTWKRSPFALPVNEVAGVERFHPDDLVPAPNTLAGATAFTTSLLSWNGRMVGWLEPDRLYRGIVKGVA